MSLTVQPFLTERLSANGLKRVKALVILDATYPNPAGYPLTPAMFGLTRFQPFEPALASVVPPEVLSHPTGGSNDCLIATVEPITNALHIYLPTSGQGTNPTAVGVGKVSNGASTASAVDATTPTIIPGKGVEAANGADLGNYQLTIQATGY